MTYGGWGPEDDRYGWESYDSGGRGGPDRHGGWGDEFGDDRRDGRTSGWTIAGYALLAVFVVAILGTVAYLVLGRGDDGGAPTAAPAASSSSSATTSAAAPQSPERVTVTERATPTSSNQGSGSSESGSSSSGSYPAGADHQGWVGDQAARCNSTDSAVIIGETTDAQYSVCVNPDNGRYYYRGSANGQGVEVDDPSVSGGTATVVNRQTVYHLSSTSLRITDNGNEIYDEPTVQFWSR